MSSIALISRGDYFPLSPKVAFDIGSCQRAFEGREWIQYNPLKPINRWGLALTTRDGTESTDYAVNGLHSLRELHENDVIGNDVEGLYNQLTPLAREVGFDFWSRKVLGPDYANLLGRCHFIKLNRGGHFPPHRDGNTTIPLEQDYFRLFVPISNCGSEELIWLQNHRQFFFTEKPGVPYFINTLVTHSVFSFVDDCVFVVLNIKAAGASKILLHLGIA